MVRSKNTKRLFGTVAPILAMLMLSGCHNYLARTEGITSFAGESLAQNEVIAVVDTWPDGFDDTDIPTDGQRQAAAVNAYKKVASDQPAQQNPLQLVVAGPQQ